MSRIPKVSTCFGFRVVGLDGQLSITDKTGQGEKDSKISFDFFEKSCDVNFTLDCLRKTSLFTIYTDMPSIENKLSD